MNEPTHIVVVWKSNEAEFLYRATDGVQIGQRKEHVVLFGENPNKKESRVFIDSPSASRYLRETVTANDIKFNAGVEEADLRPVILEERDAEQLVIAPSGAIELPGSGTRKLN